MNKKMMITLLAGALATAAVMPAIASTITTEDAALALPATLTIVAAEEDSTEQRKTPPQKIDTSAWTDEQKSLLDTAMKRDNDEATRTTALSSLVSAGLISQEDADRMAKGPQGKMNIDTSSWTDEQKSLLDTAMERDNDEATRTAALSSLVSAGLISQENADLMAKGHQGRMNIDTSSWTDEQKSLLDTAMKRDNDEATRSAALSSLVSAGLIFQENADLMNKGPGKHGFMDAASAGTTENQSQTVVTNVA